MFIHPPNSAPSVSAISGCSISETGTILLLEAKMSSRAALLISIEMCLHGHQYSRKFLIPPIRSPPLPLSFNIPSSIPLLLHPSRLLMQGNPGLRHGSAAHSSLHPWKSCVNPHGKPSARSFHFARSFHSIEGSEESARAGKRTTSISNGALHPLALRVCSGMYVHGPNQINY